jgi:hypothetical protein
MYVDVWELACRYLAVLSKVGSKNINLTSNPTYSEYNLKSRFCRVRGKEAWSVLSLTYPHVSHENCDLISHLCGSVR